MKEKPNKFPEQHQPDHPGKETAMHPEPEYIREDYRGSAKLKNKVALITGGDSGIGRSVAVHFAREGADVAIVYLDENEDANKTRELVESEGRKCLTLRGDIRSREFCEQAVEETKKELGGLNILVNNAAVQYPKDDLEDISAEQFENTFQTNIFPYYYFSHAAVEGFGKDDCIINTTSVTAYRGSAHLIDYASTKGAILSFTRSLASNLASKGIRVNAVAPGPIWTPLIPSSFEKVSEFGKSAPMGRAGQPSEVGPAYVFLASGDGSYITGQVLHVNGGEFIGA
jgi:NAD(P)-dependent dehydrogenase (short-subunit alcohol dehydrogenase family)